MPTPIDRYMGLEWLKKKVDAAHKEAKQDAADELAKQRDENGVMELASKAFGPEAGTYKYSKTRKKKVVEFHLDSQEELYGWIALNKGAAIQYAIENAESFAEFHFTATGEVPDGTTRVEYEEPAKISTPKLYGFKPEIVEAHLGGNLIESVNGLLLSDGDA